MKTRYEYIDEANRRHDELIDELVSKYKTDVEEEDKNMICPECNSEKIIKFGYRLTRKGKIQRYQCQVCARVFSEQVNEERD